QQFSVNGFGDSANLGPGKAVGGIGANQWTPLKKFPIQFAGKVFFNTAGEIGRVLGLGKEPRFALNNIGLQRSNIAGDNRQTEAIAQRQKTTLEDMRVGEQQYIGSFKEHFDF